MAYYECINGNSFTKDKIKNYTISFNPKASNSGTTAATYSTALLDFNKIISFTTTLTTERKVAYTNSNGQQGVCVSSATLYIYDENGTILYNGGTISSGTSKAYTPDLTNIKCKGYVKVVLKGGYGQYTTSGSGQTYTAIAVATASDLNVYGYVD